MENAFVVLGCSLCWGKESKPIERSKRCVCACARWRVYLKSIGAHVTMLNDVLICLCRKFRFDEAIVINTKVSPCDTHTNTFTRSHTHTHTVKVNLIDLQPSQNRFSHTVLWQFSQCTPDIIYSWKSFDPIIMQLSRSFASIRRITNKIQYTLLIGRQTPFFFFTHALVICIP